MPSTKRATTSQRNIRLHLPSTSASRANIDSTAPEAVRRWTERALRRISMTPWIAWIGASRNPLGRVRCFCATAGDRAWRGARPPRPREYLGKGEASRQDGRGVVSGAGVGAGVDIHQAGGVDRRIGLGCRERGVAEEFLNRAQVASGSEEVGGEAVAQGMGGGGGGEAQL